MARFSPYDLDEYVLERLPLNKRITLECELEEDTKLIKELEQRKRIINSIRQINRDSLLEEFENWDSESGEDRETKKKDKKKKKEFSLPPLFSYLSVFFIVLVVYIITSNYDPTKNFTPEKAYAFYFEPLRTNIMFPDSDDPEFTDERIAVLEKYESGDHAEAIEDMTIYLEDHDDPVIQLFSGISCIAEGQNETGVQRLMYAGNRDKSLTIYTNWFIALSYMNTGEMDASREYLQRVTDEGGYYSAKARELFHMAGGLKLGDREIEQF